MTLSDLRYESLVFKASGEALRGERSLDPQHVKELATTVASVHALGVRIAVVVGGGNIIRGTQAGAYGLQRRVADEMGMLATAINAIVLEDLLLSSGIPAAVFGRGHTASIRQAYDEHAVLAAYRQHVVCILAGGSGVAGKSTDVPAVDLAIRLGAPAVIMSKFGVGGVYDRDPRFDDAAVELPTLSVTDALDMHLGFMDAEALRLAREHGRKIHVVAAEDCTATERLLLGESVGSVVLPL